MRNEKSEMLVCFALKEEVAPFRKIAAGKLEVSILITGVGRQNAEKSVREFLTGGASVPASQPGGSLAQPELVLTCGFAGGLNPVLKLGDVVFECGMQNAECGIQSEPAHVGCYEKLIAAGAKPAKFFCADRIATTVAEKKKLRDKTGADAVEMESGAIHAVCRERGIPCATVRVISDTAGEDLPLDFNQFSKPDLSLDYGKLARAIAKSPGKIGALMQLREKTRCAAEQLAKVLSRILQEPR